MADFRQKKRIGDMLLEAGIITQEQLEDALEKNKTAHKKIGRDACGSWLCDRGSNWGRACNTVKYPIYFSAWNENRG